MKRKNKCISKLNISEGRRTYHGVNGIITHYYIRCDPYLGICRYKIRIIICAFIEYINCMYLPRNTYIVPKDQTIYSSV